MNFTLFMGLSLISPLFAAFASEVAEFAMAESEAVNPPLQAPAWRADRPAH